jgi:hypothetical protein
MDEAQFQQFYPLVFSWIQQTVADHAGRAWPVASAHFPRLPAYFQPATLASARFVAVAATPTPPLSELGLDQFADFENIAAAGITYLDTIFVLESLVDDDALFFHELVHVIQWGILGPERFHLAYAEGLEQEGCRESPLEAMAYAAGDLFQSHARPFAVEEWVETQLGMAR